MCSGKGPLHRRAARTSVQDGLSTSKTSGISSARSYRTLRDGSSQALPCLATIGLSRDKSHSHIETPDNQWLWRWEQVLCFGDTFCRATRRPTRNRLEAYFTLVSGGSSDIPGLAGFSQKRTSSARFFERRLPHARGVVR
jgi:hypothetical protein